MDETEEDYLIQEMAWTESLWNKAVECFSTRRIMKKLVINLIAYTEIKLYRACKHIYLGNKVKIQWWVNMNHMIQEATGEKSGNNNNDGSSSAIVTKKDGTGVLPVRASSCGATERTL